MNKSPDTSRTTRATVAAATAACRDSRRWSSPPPTGPIDKDEIVSAVGHHIKDRLNLSQI